MEHSVGGQHAIGAGSSTPIQLTSFHSRDKECKSSKGRGRNMFCKNMVRMARNNIVRDIMVRDSMVRDSMVRDSGGRDSGGRDRGGRDTRDRDRDTRCKDRLPVRGHSCTAGSRKDVSRVRPVNSSTSRWVFM